MRIGIDVGGTKIEGLALGDDGRELARHRVEPPTAYEESCRRSPTWWSGSSARRSRAAPPPSASAPPASCNREAASSATPTCSRSTIALSIAISATAIGRPVRLANDAKCFVLSEAVDGAGAPPPDLDRSRPDVVFGATLGTGVGGGIVVDGRVLTGENGAATEWSHTTLPFLRDGEHAPDKCHCPHADCIEAFTSGRGLAGDVPRSRRRRDQGDRARAPRRRR